MQSLLYFLGGIADSDSTYSDCLSVCMSVTLAHPEKVTGWNEMPLGRDTYVVPSNTVLDRGSSPTMGRVDIAGQNPQFTAIDAAYCQITLALVFKMAHYST